MGRIVAEQLSTNYQPELLRRQRTAALTVRALLALTVALSFVAFLSRNRFRQQDNAPLEMALKITIFFFGVGSVVLRRARFAAMRLQDIAALRGISGLLVTLEKTTIQVALLGSSVAVFGFIASVMTGNAFYSYGAGLVALFVLLNCYPTLGSWQKTVAQFCGAANGPPPPPIFENPEEKK
jgi:hypothetical protein